MFNVITRTRRKVVIFHNLIKEKRQKMSLTQMELANKLLVSNKTISNWETGKTLPDIENIILISKYLNISLDDLFLGDETMVGKLRENQQERKFYRIVTISLISAIIVGTIGYLFLKLFYSSNMILIESNLSGYLSIPMFILIIYILTKINWHSLISILNKKIIIAIGFLLFLYAIMPVMDIVDGLIRGFVGSGVN
ncbi:helix-turn-helix domain-containing protein [Leuconostoc mesenteroides]|uniref:helix-turn-helix domain-containing protein n=2 Tax=Leuconostoc mesenteroides TaxID=1245 RepID=UPI001C70EFE1|nr:helix-turn-helix transcriptional regulator [Leuconostoc mesenteroides]MCV2530290.1 helix-turn-helix domain-containing protein [Leuconostoc mesenteroides]WVI90281.1 helix-turn-helix transcriptional regulator [Leuconostoc mesenteroides]